MTTENQTQNKSWSGRKKIIVFLMTIVCLVGLYFLLSFLIVVYIAQPVKVEGSGMAPTLNHGDKILLNKQISEIKRCDIVVFYFPMDKTKSLIKRIVGLPGDTIRMDEAGQLYINGTITNEPYVRPERNRNPRRIPEQRIAEDKYFVMGDNRDGSNDSRSFGAIEKELIYGKVMWRYSPMTGEVE